MKSIKSCFICFAIMFFFESSSVNAQFVKNVLNNAKQTAQNRSSDKANQVTNKAFDQLDSLTQKKPKHKRKRKHDAAISDTLQPTGYNILMRYWMPYVKSDHIAATENALWQNDKYLVRRSTIIMAPGERRRC